MDKKKGHTIISFLNDNKLYNIILTYFGMNDNTFKSCPRTKHRFHVLDSYCIKCVSNIIRHFEKNTLT